VVRALANEYVAQGQPQSATVVLRRFVRAYPSNGGTAAALSALLLQQGAWQESLEVMGGVLDSSAKSEVAVSNWLDLLTQSGKAKERLEQAIEHVAPTEASAHQLYLVARLALHLGENQSAERLLNRCEDLAPELAAVHLALGQIYVQRYNWQEAIEAAQRAIDRDDADFRAHKLLGQAHLGLDNYAEATAALNSAVRLNRSDLQSNLLLAEVYELSGKRLQAKRQNQIILELDPTNQKALQEAVLTAFRDQDLDQVRQHLQVMEENQSLQSSYRRCKALLDLVQNENPVAYAGELATIIEAYPDDLQAKMELAQLRFSGGQNSEAEKLLRQVIKADPQRFQAQELLCVLLIQDLNYEEAIASLRSRLALHPNRIPWQKTLLATLTYDQQFETTGQIVPTFLTNHNLDDRDRLVFQYDLLTSLVLAGKFDEAVATLEGLIESPTSQLFFKTILLNLYHSSGRQAHAVGLAEQWFQAAALADQNDYRGLLRSAYWADGRFADAELLMLDWLELDPDAIAPTLALSDAFRQAGKINDAIELVSASLPFGQSQILFRNLVSLHMAADDRQTAIQILRDRLAVEFKNKPRRVQPDAFQLTLRAQLCNNLIVDGRYDVAEQELTAWLRQPADLLDHKRVLRLLSWCYQLSGKKSLSVQQLEEIHRLDPADIRTNNDLGYTWAAAGMNLDRAEKMIRSALATRPRSVAYLDSLGWVLYKKGEFTAAYEWLIRANRGPLVDWDTWLFSEDLQRGSDDPVIRDHLGDAAWRLGKEEQAIKCWEDARRLVADREQDVLTIEQRTILESAPKKIEAAKAGTTLIIAPASTDT
ncbi:MAG: tetratricopeptide repeat protein, partial [Planctomycetes bacterium]|nr:tetratricopeptide repeat protein [Planctomycetota bacterium]